MYDKAIRPKVDKTLGYEYFMDKDHPLASTVGKVYLHRHVASVNLGRWLTSQEVVHHKDGNKTNNTIKNLEVLSHREHTALHHPRTIPLHPCSQCGTPTRNKYFCSHPCSQTGRRVVERPSHEQLIEDLRGSSFCAVGRKYNVSDNAIRKWVRYYRLNP